VNYNRGDIFEKTPVVPQQQSEGSQQDDEDKEF
jgi:hypothetical protein